MIKEPITKEMLELNIIDLTERVKKLESLYRYAVGTVEIYRSGVYDIFFSKENEERLYVVRRP